VPLDACESRYVGSNAISALSSVSESIVIPEAQLFSLTPGPLGLPNLVIEHLTNSFYWINISLN
jgi:hypothetical protein